MFTDCVVVHFFLRHHIVAVVCRSHVEDHVVRIETQCLFDCCIREIVLLVSII